MAEKFQSSLNIDSIKSRANQFQTEQFKSRLNTQISKIGKDVQSEYLKVQYLTDTANIIYANSKDPREEANADILADRIHMIMPTISRDEARRNYRSIIKGVTGDDMDASSVFDLLGKKISQGFKASAAGIANYGYLLGTVPFSSNTPDEVLKQRREEHLKKMNELASGPRLDYYNEFMDSFAEQAVLAVGDFIPSMAMSTAPMLLGQVVSAFCPPAGAILKGVSVAMAGVMEAGSSSLDLLNAGADYDTALGFSTGVGILNGSLELLGDLPKDYVAKQFGEKLAATKLLKKSVKDKGMKTLKKTVGDLMKFKGLEYVGNLISETATETLQELNTMYISNLALDWEEKNRGKSFGDEFKYTPQEMAEALSEVASSTFKGQLLIGLVGPLADSVVFGDVKHTSKANKIFNITPDSMLISNKAVNGIDEKTGKFKGVKSAVLAENEKFEPLNIYQTKNGLYVSDEDKAKFNAAVDADRNGYVFVKNKEADANTKAATKQQTNAFIENELPLQKIQDKKLVEIDAELSENNEIVVSQDDFKYVTDGIIDSGSIEGIQDIDNGLRITKNGTTFDIVTSTEAKTTKIDVKSILDSKKEEAQQAKKSSLEMRAKVADRNTNAQEQRDFLKENDATLQSRGVSEEKVKADRVSRDNLLKDIERAEYDSTIASGEKNTAKARHNAKRTARGVTAVLTRLTRSLGKGLSDIDVVFTHDDSNATTILSDGNIKTNKGQVTLLGKDTVVNGKTVKAGTFVVNLTKFKSPTTALHEVGHIYLMMLGDNFTKVKGFIDNFANELRRDADAYRLTEEGKNFEGEFYVGRETQEAFAKKLEAYAYRGEVVPELKNIFDQIIAAIKDFIKAAKYTLTDNEKAMFDELLTKVGVQEEVNGVKEGTFEDSQITQFGLMRLGLSDDPDARKTFKTLSTNLKEAVKMFKAGTEPREILQKTGWNQINLNGKQTWVHTLQDDISKFNFDKVAELTSDTYKKREIGLTPINKAEKIIVDEENGKILSRANLRDIIKDGNIFTLYPELKKAVVSFYVSDDKNTVGFEMHDYIGKEISLCFNLATLDNNTEFLTQQYFSQLGNDKSIDFLETKDKQKLKEAINELLLKHPKDYETVKKYMLYAEFSHEINHYGQYKEFLPYGTGADDVHKHKFSMGEILSRYVESEVVGRIGSELLDKYPITPWVGFDEAIDDYAWYQTKGNLDEIDFTEDGIYEDFISDFFYQTNKSIDISDEMAEKLYNYLKKRNAFKGVEDAIIRAGSKGIDGELGKGICKKISRSGIFYIYLDETWARKDMFAEGLANIVEEAYSSYLDSTQTEEGKTFYDSEIADRKATPQEIEEAKRQYDEVRNKYYGTDKWMKAPNGKRTNLTEKQWILSRTTNFKKWFGDWESAVLVKWARDVWNGNSESDKAYHFIIDGNAKNKIDSATGTNINEVVLSPSHIRHIKEHHGINENLRGQIDITPEDIATIPYLINNLDSIEQRTKEGKIVENEYRIAKKINGISYVGTCVVSDKKLEVRTLYIQKNKEAANATSPNENVQNALPINNIKQDIQIIKDSYANASKIIDENGEPKVVYHGTNYSFTAFDNVFGRLPLFFTNNKNIASDYGRKQLGVFLNARNIDEFDANGKGAYELGINYPDGKLDNIDDVVFESKENGKDGVIINNVRDSKDEYGDTIADDYVVFNPNQVKSIDNIGTYNDTTGNIFYDSEISEQSQFEKSMAEGRILPYPDKLRYVKSAWAKADTQAQYIINDYKNEKIVRAATNAVDTFLEGDGKLSDIKKEDYPKIINNFKNNLDKDTKEAFDNLKLKEENEEYLAKLILRITAWKNNDSFESRRSRFLKQFTYNHKGMGQYLTTGKKNIIDLVYKLNSMGAFGNTYTSEIDGEETSFDFPVLHKIYNKLASQQSRKTLSEKEWTAAREEIIDNVDTLMALTGDSELNDVDLSEYFGSDEQEGITNTSLVELASKQNKQLKKDAKERERLISKIRELNDKNTELASNEETVKNAILKLKKELGIQELIENEDGTFSVKLENGDVKSDVSQIVSEITQLRKDAGKFEEKSIRTAESNLKKLDDLRQQRRELRAEIDNLTTTVEDQDRSIEGLEREKDKLEVRIDKVTYSMKDYRSKMYSALRKNSKNEKLLDAEKEKVVKANENIKELKATIKTDEKQVNSLTKKLDKEIEKNNELISQIDELKALKKEEKELYKGDIKNYENEINALNNELNLYISDMQRLIERNNNLEERTETLKEKLYIEKEQRKINSQRRLIKRYLNAKSGNAALNKQFKAFAKIFLNYDSLTYEKEGVKLNKEMINALASTLGTIQAFSINDEKGNLLFGFDGKRLNVGFNDFNSEQLDYIIEAVKRDRSESRAEEQARINDREEFVSNVVNKTEFEMKGARLNDEDNIKIQELVGKGLSEQDATNQVIRDKIEQINRKDIKGTTEYNKSIKGIKGRLFNSPISMFNTLWTNARYMSKSFADSLFFDTKEQKIGDRVVHKERKGLNGITDERIRNIKSRMENLFTKIKEAKGFTKDKELNAYLNELANKEVQIDADGVRLIKDAQDIPENLKAVFEVYKNDEQYMDAPEGRILTVQECMAIHEHLRQREDIYHLVEGNHISVYELAWIEQQFAKDGSLEEYREIADIFQESYAERFEAMRETCLEVENRELDRVEVYSPEVNTESKYDLKITLNPYGSTRRAVNGVNDSMTITRQGGRSAIDLHYVSGFERNINNQEAYITGAKFYAEWDRILCSDDGLKQDIINQYGNDFYNTLLAQINTTRGVSEANPLRTMDNIVSKIRNNYMMARLAFNLSSVLQQPASWFLGISKYGLSGMLRATNAIRQYGLKGFNQFVYSHSPQLENAVSFDLDKAKQSLIENPTGLDKILNPIRRFGEIGLTMMEKTDRITRNILWYAAYQDNMNAGMSETEASERATQWTLNVQSSSQAKDNALMYSNKSPFWKATLMFTNQLNKEWNMFIGEDGLGSLFEGDNALKKVFEKDYKQFMATLISMAFSTTWVMLANGKLVHTPEDKDTLEDLLGDFFEESVSRVPVFGNLAKRSFEGFAYNQTDDIVSRTSDLIKKINLPEEDKNKANKIKTSVINEVTSIFDLAGLPTTEARRIFYSFYDNYEFDAEHFEDGGWAKSLGGEWYDYFSGDDK